MPQHPKTVYSYLNKAELYYQEEGVESPLIEEHAVLSLVPNLNNKHVFSIGCGAGKELHTLQRKGALTITAIEPSEFLRSKAKEEAKYADITDGDIEALTFPDGCFDFIYCSHVLHYFKDWTKAISEIRRVLSSNGQLLITLHHAIDWGLQRQKDNSRLLGFDSENNELGNYLETREIHDKWYGNFEVVFYARSVSTSINEITKFGFSLVGINEAGLDSASKFPLYLALLLKKS
jgi:ubiquinone/menaquinone biosynthesis C-methylase UbiE